MSLERSGPRTSAYDDRVALPGEDLDGVDHEGLRAHAVDLDDGEGVVVD